jgi:hypothetical protein
LGRGRPTKPTRDTSDRQADVSWISQRLVVRTE